MKLWRWKRDTDRPDVGGGSQEFDPEDIAALKQLAQKSVVGEAGPARLTPAVSRTEPDRQPTVRSTQLNVRVRSETRRRAQAIAARRSTSHAEVIERAVDDLFSQDAGAQR